jgi:type I restriction enzyme S subunit
VTGYRSAVPLKELLKRSRQTISIEPSVVYREVTVRMHGKGIVERGVIQGSEIAASTRFEAKAGQFIISRIDARHGASGLVPDELDGAIVTNDFPLFDIECDRLDPRFFHWFSKTQTFIELCKRASEGTTNRVRLVEERFTALSMPLPPLDEQRRIVARIDHLAHKLTEVRKLRDYASDELNALWPSVLNKALSGMLTSSEKSDGSAKDELEALKLRNNTFEGTKANNAHPHKPCVLLSGPYQLPPSWSWTTLGSVLTHLVDCVNDTPEFADSNTGFLGLKSTNIRPYHFDLNQKWFVTEDDYKLWNRREQPRGGDIVLTREAPVGYACQIPEGTVACLTQRLMLLRPETGAIMPLFLLHYLNSRVFLDQVLEHSRGLTTPHIRVQDAPKFRLPLPPIAQQQRIVTKLAMLKDKIDEVRRLHTETDKEIGAILPAVLDFEFRGSI